jgi:hypothetical protein
VADFDAALELCLYLNQPVGLELVLFVRQARDPGRNLLQSLNNLFERCSQVVRRDLDI